MKPDLDRMLFESKDTSLAQEPTKSVPTYTSNPFAKSREYNILNLDT